MRKTLFFIIVLAAMLASCSGGEARYRIGVSQCSDDIWRDKQNAELRMGAYFHDNVELKFAAAYDSDERQVQQIDSLVSDGIDLLIVAPNQVRTISPAIERHNGFMDAVKDAPGIEVAASLQGDWTEPTAYETCRQWRAENEDVHIDLVFGANDRTAMGARKALGAGTLYCGIDGLPGKDGGIQLVRDSLLDASYIYPTHGDQIIDLAVSILEGKPYQKETMLMSALVTKDNAKVLLMQSEELMQQAEYLDQLHDKADNYLHKLDAQRVVNWLAIGIIILLVIVFVLFYLFHLRKITLQRERVANTLWNMEVDKEVTAPAPEAEATSVAAEEAPVALPLEDSSADTPAENVGGAFIARFREAVESRLEDSDLSVDDLAADMNLSRVQLYRKVKAVTGFSPVELLRTARLNRAYQLLLTSDKSVSEVAYAVGFTAPSYFTKCFKEEYGMVPGDVRK